MTCVRCIGWYAGYRRLLTVWQGTGILLNNLELTPGQVHEFDGAEKIFCKNLSPEVTDVGFMFRGDQFQAEMKHLHLDSDQTLQLKVGINFLFCAKGEFQSGLLTIKDGDTLKFETAVLVQLKLNQAQLQLIHIYLREKSLSQPTIG